MGSILDYLSNNWGDILGSGAGAPGGGTLAPSSAPAPSAAPNFSGGGYGGGYSPSGVGDINPITNQPPYYDPGIGIQTPGYDPMAGVSQNPTVGALKIDPLTGAPKGSELDLSGGGYGGGYTPPVPPMAPPGNAAAIAGGPPVVPMGPPGNAAAVAGGPPGATMPMNITPAAAGGPAPPMQIAPATTGAVNPNAARLAMLLGAQQGSPWKNAVQSGLTALGGGLSTVQGNTGAGAFARGMGGALTAGSRNQQQQQAQNFNMMSTYFRDMMAAQNADDNQLFRRAQAAYLNARAVQTTQGNMRGAHQNDPFWKTMKVEDNVNKYQSQQQDALFKKWKAFNDAGNPVSPEQMQKEQETLQANVDARRKQLYGAIGVSPKDAEKYLTMGQSKENPFPASGMSQNEFDHKVVLGAWYDTGGKYDQNGNYSYKNPDGTTGTIKNGQPGAEVILQRAIPPGGWDNYGNATNQPQQSPGSQLEQYYNDQLALSPQ
jgi:hypothetical protein